MQATLDLIEEHIGENFIPLCNGPSQLLRLVEVIRLHGDKFCRLLAAIAHFTGQIKAGESINADLNIDDGIRVEVIGTLKKMCTQLNELGLSMSEKMGQDLLQVLIRNDFLANKTMLDEFIRRIIDEIESVYILTIPANKKDYYDQRDKIFGDEVLSKFPTAAREAEEAGKCYATGRNIACVFH